MPTIEELQARIAFLEETLEKRNHELSQEISELVIVKSDLEKRTSDLNQRIRELKSVIQITTLSDTANIPMKDFYSGVLDIVIASFRYPEITCAELKIGNEVYRSENFLQTRWKLGRGLMDQYHEMIGYMTVYYLEERPEEDHGPFTKEEKNLMVMISRYLVQIIKRKQFEEQNRKFQAVISQSPSWIIITDDSGMIEYTNESFTKTFGFAARELNGRLADLGEKSEENTRAYEEMTQILLKGDVWKGTIRMLRKDQTVIWNSLAIFPLKNNGAIPNFVVIGNDITYQKVLETQKMEQQERYQKLVENIPLAIAIIDRNGICTYANDMTEKLLDMKRSSFIGKSIKAFLPESYTHRIEDEFARMVAEKRSVTMERKITMGNRNIILKSQRIPLLDENRELTGIMVIADDITEAKRQDLLLRIQHKIDSLANVAKTLKASIKTAFHYLMQIDWVQGGGVYLFDDQREQLSLIFSEGLSDEYVGKVSRFPLGSEPVNFILGKKPRYARTDDYSELLRSDIMKEGLTLIVSLPLIYQDQVLGSLNLASRSVDELSLNDKLFIESLASRLANLIILVETREKLIMANLELNASLQEIREKQEMLIQKSKLESLGELAAGLAHEINQPLSVISLAFENITYKLEESEANKDYFARKAQTISLNMEKIRQLIDHIRVFSRDQASVMFEKTDVNLAIRESLSLLKARMEKQTIRIDVDLHRGRCFTLGNLTKLEQVIMNLISNARDAVEEKASLQKGTGFTKHLCIKSEVEDDKIFIRVEDNGIGISPENLPKIFNPFFTTKPPGQGTGLGLAIAYGIITEMKGNIEVLSENGKFTKILLTLPKI